MATIQRYRVAMVNHGHHSVYQLGTVNSLPSIVANNSKYAASLQFLILNCVWCFWHTSNSLYCVYICI